MKKLLVLAFTITLISSCSVKNEEEQLSLVTGHSNQAINPNDDSDGDLVKDGAELEIGRSPYIANLPDMRVRFIQNYKIIIEYTNAEKESKEYLINTNVTNDNPDFKYRVGDALIKGIGHNTAARVGRFSSHSWGNIVESDLSLVGFPEVDSRFYEQHLLNLKKIINDNSNTVENVKIVLENSVKLNENNGFLSIKNLKVNHRFYNYKEENYELLNTTLVDRVFHSGVNEVFESVIDSVPLDLIVENYLKRGEFLISEVEDYEIPDMNVTYRSLLNSVRTKSIPVVYNAPDGLSVNYVSANGRTARFAEIMNKLFDDKFRVEQNEVVKINQFENNLSSYTYLSELKDENKKGKWFVLTNKINKHYLSYEFLPSDFIVLSYTTGDILATQPQEKIISYREYAKSNEANGGVYALGNVSANAQVQIQLKPEKLWGDQIKSFKDTFTPRGCSGGGNCVNRDFKCDYNFNIFSELDTEFHFKNDFSMELSRIIFTINNNEFLLSDLINNKKVDVYWLDKNLHISIPKISNIIELSNSEDSVISIKLLPKTEMVFNGIYLINASGRDMNPTCPEIAVQLAHSQNWPVSTRSIMWDQISRWIGNPALVGQDRQFTQEFSSGMTSIITNYHN